MRTILHIGRHKTGTSSLQKFLSDNYEVLRGAGILYPKYGRRGIAHHQLAESFTAKNMRNDLAQCELNKQDFFKKLQSEESFKYKVVILSSEAFQNTRPQAVYERFKECNTGVTVYLREQYSYLVSAYQQKVHAKAYAESLKKFKSEFNPDYKNFMDSWVKSFGKKSIAARIFEKQSLIANDVVQDFFNTNNLIIPSDVTRSEGNSNPSIGGALLELKRAINNIFEKGILPDRLYAALGQMVNDSPHYQHRPSLERSEVVGYRQSFEEINEYLRTEFFGDLNPLFKNEFFYEQSISDAEVFSAMQQALESLLQHVMIWREKGKSEMQLIACLRDLQQGMKIEGDTIDFSSLSNRTRDIKPFVLNKYTQVMKTT